MPVLLIESFLFTIFCLYLITQIGLPLFFPKEFEINWIFKKRKKLPGSIEEKVDSLTNQKNELDSAADEVLNEADEKLRKAQEIKDLAKNLKK